jgi:acyl-CoA thioesterase-1
LKILLSALVLWAATVVLAQGATAPAAQATPPGRTILVFGDSISAAYGIRVEQGWVSLLQRKLESQGYGYHVTNASVSGETTAGGLARLPRALKVHKPGIVVIELGGNDGLRALPVAQMRANLMRMVTLSRESGARVLLVGMRIPPNYGPVYTQQFHAVYDEVGRHFKIPSVPFLLNDVALNGNLMQEDGIHPNVEGQPKLLDNIWPQLSKMLVK